MKLKKIKNYVLTFIICLFGAIAFNASDVNAYTIYDNFSVNENVVYSTSDNIRSLYLYGRDSSNMSVYYYNIESYSYIFYPTCSYNSVSHVISCTGNRITGSFGGSYSISQNNLTLQLIKGDEITFDRIRANWADGDTHLFEEVDNYELGYNLGYQVGEDVGFDNGYDVGFLEGADSSNTLVGMVGAIFTGPVTMFQQIFNFNVLGINFAEMLFGLVTLLVVIWLVKKFI